MGYRVTNTVIFPFAINIIINANFKLLFIILFSVFSQKSKKEKYFDHKKYTKVALVYILAKKS